MKSCYEKKQKIKSESTLNEMENGDTYYKSNSLRYKLSLTKILKKLDLTKTRRPPN